VVAVGDVRLGERRLQTAGVRPRVADAAHAPALPDFDEQTDAALAQRGEERLEIELVDADRDDVRRD